MLKTAFENSFCYKIAAPFINSYQQSGTKRFLNRLQCYWTHSAIGKWFHRFTYEKESSMDHSLYRRFLDKVGTLANKIAQPIHDAFEPMAKNSQYFSTLQEIAAAPPEEILKVICIFMLTFSGASALILLLSGAAMSTILIFVDLAVIFTLVFLGRRLWINAFTHSFFMNALKDLLK